MKNQKTDSGNDSGICLNVFGEFTDRDGFSRHCRALRRAGEVLEIVYRDKDQQHVGYISIGEFTPGEGCNLGNVPNFVFDELFNATPKR